MPEFEFQRFFFLLFSIFFCSLRKLECLLLYAKAFFSIWRMFNSFANESILLEAKQTPYRCSADAKDP